MHRQDRRQHQSAPGQALKLTIIHSNQLNSTPSHPSLMPYSTPLRASDTIPGRITLPRVGRYFSDTHRAALALDAVAEAHHTGDLDAMVDTIKNLVTITDLWSEDSDVTAILDELWEYSESDVTDWLCELDQVDDLMGLLGQRRKVTLKSDCHLILPDLEPGLIPGNILTGELGDWVIGAPGAVVLLHRECPLTEQHHVWCRLIPGTQVKHVATHADIPSVLA